MSALKKYFLVFPAALLSFLLLPGCGGGGISFVDIEKTDTVTSGDYDVFQLIKTGNTEVTYTLDMGSETRDVYFIFTNTHASKTKTSPEYITEESRSAADTKTTVDQSMEAGPVAMRGKPEITIKNREVLTTFDQDTSRAVYPLDDIVPRFDTVGAPGTLNIDSATRGVDATCRYRAVDPDTGKVVNIWVADNCWTGYSGSDEKSYLLDSTMITALGEMFLSEIPSDEDDIYSWVTGIYGEEWGEHSYSNLISSTTANDEITIFFSDIDNDDDDFVTAGGVAGFFYAAHNMKKSSLSWSNERVMFFMDAVMFAYDAPGGGDWDISDPWPSETISTLVHEFQHMIHFYQKVILRNSGQYTDTWIDEMMAMATEDLLSNTISTTFGIDLTGPRGIVGSDLSEGSPVITSGRIPWYTWYNPTSLTDFYLGSEMDDILRSYGASYSFGAYLLRNFNGAEILQALMGNSYTDYRAISYAAGVTSTGNVSFGELLRKHAIAALLSPAIDNAPDEMKFNNGSTGFTGSFSYKVGSINMFNYSLDSGASTGTFNMYNDEYTGTSVPPASQTFVVAGKNLTGNHQWTIKLVDGVEMDVVVKIPN